MNRSSWVLRSESIQKDWGHEVRWDFVNQQIFGKKIFIKEGFSTRTKYFTNKNETFFIEQGRLEAVFAPESYLKNRDVQLVSRKVLVKGDVLQIQSGCPYTLKALTDCNIYEISSSGNSEFCVLDDRRFSVTEQRDKNG